MVFDFLEKTTLWLYEKDLYKNWFNFIGWVFMSAVGFGLAKSSGSLVIFTVAFTSTILVFFYGWHSIYIAIKALITEHENPSKKLLLTTIFVATLLPIVLMFYIISAVSAYVSNIS